MVGRVSLSCVFSSAASTAAKISVLTDWQCLINWSRCILLVSRFTQTAKKEKLSTTVTEPGLPSLVNSMQLRDTEPCFVSGLVVSLVGGFTCGLLTTVHPELDRWCSSRLQEEPNQWGTEQPEPISLSFWWP